MGFVARYFSVLFITLWPEKTHPWRKEEGFWKIPGGTLSLKKHKGSTFWFNLEMSFQGVAFFCVSVQVLQEFACYCLTQNTVTWQPGKVFAWLRKGIQGDRAVSCWIQHSSWMLQENQMQLEKRGLLVV